jgi:hypothetical protein
MPVQRFVVCGQDQSVIEERFVEIGEVQAVLVEVGQALRFIPHNLHILYCSYNIVYVKTKLAGIPNHRILTQAATVRSGCAMWHCS